VLGVLASGSRHLAGTFGLFLISFGFVGLGGLLELFSGFVELRSLLLSRQLRVIALFVGVPGLFSELVTLALVLEDRRAKAQEPEEEGRKKIGFHS
jgi:hypothetical protein